MGMKVFQINSVCGIRSTGRIVTDIHNKLLSMNIDSYVGYGRGNALNCNNAIRIGNTFDNFAHMFLTRVFDRHGFASKAATKRFIYQLQKINPDVIHLHNIHGYYLNIRLLLEYLKDCGKKIFWTLHDCWGFTGHCAYFDFVGCNKWKTCCKNCPQSRAYPSSYLCDNSTNNFLDKKELFTNIDDLTIITPSNWLAELVKQSYLGAYPVEVIPNGINLEVFKYRESQFRDKYNLSNKFILLGVASPWSSRKGFDDFVELSKLIPDNYHIILIGLSKSQLQGLPGNITGIAQTNDAVELAEIYSTVDVFFNPTYEDNYPTVNLEALACNTPVITYNTGGSPEIIDDNCGYVVNKKDFDAVLKRLRLMCLVGKSDLSYLKDVMDKELFVNKIIELYLR